MRIDSQTLDQIVAHAREESPNECCGILVGAKAQVTALHRMRNVHASPVRYEIDPNELMPVYLAADARGEEIVAFYHSHIKAPARPSETDINFAYLWPGSLHLICSLADPDSPDIRVFRIENRQFEEVSVDVGLMSNRSPRP